MSSEMLARYEQVTKSLAEVLHVIEEEKLSEIAKISG
jgi:hypothetical protein